MIDVSVIRELQAKQQRRTADWKKYQDKQKSRVEMKDANQNNKSLCLKTKASVCKN